MSCQKKIPSKTTCASWKLPVLALLYCCTAVLLYANRKVKDSAKILTEIVWHTRSTTRNPMLLAGIKVDD